MKINTYAYLTVLISFSIACEEKSRDVRVEKNNIELSASQKIEHEEQIASSTENNKDHFKDLITFFEEDTLVEIESASRNTDHCSVVLFNRMDSKAKYSSFEQSTIKSLKLSLNNMKKHGITFHLLEMPSKKMTDSLFDIMSGLTSSDSYYEKPHSLYFLRGSKIYLFTDIISSNLEESGNLLFRLLRQFCFKDAEYFIDNPRFYDVLEDC